MREELVKLRELVDAHRMKFQLARETYRTEAATHDRALDRQAAVLEGQSILQQIAQEVQQQVHTQIASVVSRSLEAVFDEPYIFKVNFERKRGRTEAGLVFERDGVEVDPMTASGGGVVDVAAFALRISCLLLARPPVRRVVILDEPFKFVSAGYRKRLCDLLNVLSQELDIQILMVTHISELVTGTVISV